MTTDRAKAFELIEAWTKQLADGMQRLRKVAQYPEAAKIKRLSIEPVVEALISVPLEARSGNVSAGNEVLASVFGSKDSIAKAFTRCAKRAQAAKSQIADFKPGARSPYDAILDLLDSMQRLSRVLRVRKGAMHGNVYRLAGGTTDPDLIATQELAAKWTKELADNAAEVSEAVDFSFAAVKSGTLRSIATNLVSVPLLAWSGKVPSELRPLVSAYHRGVKIAKAINACAAAAQKVQTGVAMWQKDFPRGQFLVQEGVLELLPALNHLKVVAAA